MALIKYPYTNLHELNLDWIIEQLNNQEGPVRSVNGKSGIVTLTGEDIVRSSSDSETVAAALNAQGTSIQTVRTQIGVTPLPTTAQTLTGAIAENAQEIADLEDDVIGSTALPTTAQTLTGAIAENTQTIANVEDNVIGNTALPTTAQTLTGAIAENTNDLANVEDNVIGNTALPTTAQTLTGAIAELNNRFVSLNTPEDKQITNTANYFTERSAFKASRVGYSVIILSYVQITTAIPSGTTFADIHFDNAEGTFLLISGDGANPRIARCASGRLISDSAIPTGYYYVVGSALATV